MQKQLLNLIQLILTAKDFLQRLNSSAKEIFNNI